MKNLYSSSTKNTTIPKFLFQNNSMEKFKTLKNENIPNKTGVNWKVKIKQALYISYFFALANGVISCNNKKEFILEDGKGLITMLKEENINMNYNDVYEYNKNNNPKFENINNVNLIPAGTIILIPDNEIPAKKESEVNEEPEINIDRYINRLVNYPKVGLSFTEEEESLIQKITKERKNEFKNGITKAHPYFEFLYEECKKRELPFEFALIPIIESHFDKDAVSKNGAKGVWQIKDNTAQELELENPFNIEKSSQSGLDYCKKHYSKIKKLDPENSSENIFKFSVLAYNTGLTRTKSLYEFSDGDFAKLISNLGSKSGLRKINRFLKKKGIKELSSQKAEEISRYVYKIFATRNVLKDMVKNKELIKSVGKKSRSVENYFDWFNSIEVISNELKGLTVVIDTGHGGQERQPNSIAGHTIDEHEVCYDVSTRLVKLLKENGADVTMTVLDKGKTQIINNKSSLDKNFSKPDKDEFYNDGTNEQLNKNSGVNLNRRKKIGNKFINEKKNKKSIFISIHADALEKTPDLRGVHVIIDSETGNEKDQNLAKKIINSIDKKLVLPYGEYDNFDIKKERNPLLEQRLGILKNKDIRNHSENKANANVLVELGNMANQNDSYVLRTSETRQRYAKLIYTGIKKYYKK